ncbi:MAG TPA: protein kinase [Candidatus Polarisedimenticolia bacterium]|nr:protein kinase [Candidatus Polarisedimenticolia bacterium]
MPLAAGTHLGPYEILAPLGAGGMGEVYKARDTRLDRTVAVKVLPSHLSSNPQLRQRFEREARAVSSLNHPNICTLYDVGRQEDVDFLVMEHIDGETLTARLERGPLSVEEILKRGIEIADALDKAHRQGVVHRDLKPGNIMMTKQGAKILDFGLARVASNAGGDMLLTASPTMTNPLTAEGMIVGTFQYMSPEQLEGKEADARSDIFSMGAVLYEMAAGRKAFEGKTHAGLIGSIMKEEPRPVSTVSPLIPPALDRLIRACLAKDPEDRWQTAHDVVLQLSFIAEAGSQAGVPAPVASRRRSREMVAWAAAVVGLALAAGLAAFVMTRPAPETRVLRASILAPEGTQLNLLGIQPGPVSVSPDGKRIAFVARDSGGKISLWVRALEAAGSTPLRGTEGASYPFWSPDGKTLGFFADAALKRIDAAGGPVMRICDAPSGKGGTWNADGAILFSPAFNATIHKVQAAGGTAEAITQLDAARGENSHRFPQFLPDGRHFLYLARAANTGSNGGSAIRLGELGSGTTGSIVMHNQTHAAYASGHLLYVQDGTLMARPFDPGRLVLAGDATPVVEGVQTIMSASRGIFSASENGVLVYQPGGAEKGYELAWVDRDGKKIGILGDSEDYQEPISISPRGDQVALAMSDPASGTADIWTIEVARGVRTRFTFTPGAEINPVWSPDGRTIAFSADPRGRFSGIYTKSTVSPTDPEVLLEGESSMFVTSWSPDGKYIAYLNSDPNGSGGVDIWILPLTGERKPFPFLNSRFFENDAKFSPDGRWMAYSSDESGQRQVYVVPFPGPGGKWQVSTEGGIEPMWRHDGKEIIFANEGGDLLAAEVNGSGQTFVIGAAKKLFRQPTVLDRDVSPDGQRFLFLLGDEDSGKSLDLVVNWPAALAR